MRIILNNTYKTDALHDQGASLSTSGTGAGATALPRITSQALMQDRKDVEIEHDGKIYRLRVTRLNKLILTA